MMSGRFTSKNTRVGILLGMVLAVFLTTFGPTTEQSESKPFQLDDLPYDTVTSGDLAFRRQGGLVSELARKLSPSEQRFSHVGVVILDEDGPRVIHAVSDDSKAFDGVVIETMTAFYEESSDGALYRLPLSGDQRATLAANAKALARSRIPFDDDFDMATNDRLYCTEFVAKLVNAVAEKPLFQSSRAVGGRAYMPLDALYLNPVVTALSP